MIESGSLRTVGQPIIGSKELLDKAPVSDMELAIKDSFSYSVDSKRPEKTLDGKMALFMRKNISKETTTEAEEESSTGSILNSRGVKFAVSGLMLGVTLAGLAGTANAFPSQPADKTVMERVFNRESKGNEGLEMEKGKVEMTWGEKNQKVKTKDEIIAEAKKMGVSKDTIRYFSSSPENLDKLVKLFNESGDLFNQLNERQRDSLYSGLNGKTSVLLFSVDNSEAFINGEVMGVSTFPKMMEMMEKKVKEGKMTAEEIPLMKEKIEQASKMNKYQREILVKAYNCLYAANKRGDTNLIDGISFASLAK